MLTGNVPMHEYECQKVFFHVGMYGVLKYKLPDQTSPQFKEFVASLLKSDPKERPYADQVLDKLKEII